MGAKLKVLKKRISNLNKDKVDGFMFICPIRRCLTQEIATWHLYPNHDKSKNKSEARSPFGNSYPQLLQITPACISRDSPGIF